MKTKERETEMRRRIIGRFLKSAREATGLTQGEVARQLSYSTAQFVSNWERGLAMPPLNALPKLARILSIAPRQMIETLHRYQFELLKLRRREVSEVFRRRA